MHKWYVVQVFSGKEKKVKQRLEKSLKQKKMTDFFLDILSPTEHVSEVKNGKTKITERRTFAGYLFVHMDATDETIAIVKGTEEVVGFCGVDTNGTPIPSTDEEMGRVLKDLENKKKKISQKHTFLVDDKVKIIEGPFNGFEGTVKQVHDDKGRITATLTVFGRETAVEMEFKQVEQMTESTQS